VPSSGVTSTPSTHDVHDVPTTTPTPRCSCRQWLFLIESTPSLVFGAVMWCWLPSHPLSAWMLTPEERELVHLKVTAAKLGGGGGGEGAAGQHITRINRGSYGIGRFQAVNAT